MDTGIGTTGEDEQGLGMSWTWAETDAFVDFSSMRHISSSWWHRMNAKAQEIEGLGWRWRYDGIRKGLHGLTTTQWPERNISNSGYDNHL